MKKRIVSILTSMLMVFSLSAYVPAVGAGAETAANESTDGVSMDNSKVSVEGTNSFGNMLTDTLSEKIDEQQENNGYNVFSVEMTDTKTAQVKFETLQDCTLLVGIYDESGEKMLASGSTEVTAGEKNTTVEIETDEMPQYFYVRAFLVDTECLRPLCTAYRSPNYTQRMQEFFAKTTDDFDADKVYNFDDDKKNNFAVYSDDTIIITKQDGINEVVTADDENNNYVIENADSSITSLKTGDTFAYEYGDGNVLIVKVANIQISGTTVTITGEDTSLDEVFEYVKIDTEQDTSECEYDPSTAGDGVTYVENDENESEIQTYSSDEGSAGDSLSFNIEDKEGMEQISGSIELGMTSSLKVYYDKLDTYVEVILAAEAKLAVSLSLSGDGSFKMGELKFSPIAGVNLSVEVDLVFEFSITMELSATLKGSVGFRASLDGIENISETPTLDCDAEATGSVSVGLAFKPTLDLIDDNIAGVEFEGKMEAEAEISNGVVTDFVGPVIEKHNCSECYNIDVTARITLSAEASLFDKDWLTVEYEHPVIEIPLGQFYYSRTYHSFGRGECPHKSYNTTIIVYDPFYPVSDPEIKIDYVSYTPNKRGKVFAFLNKGEHQIYAAKSMKGMYDGTFKVDDNKKIIRINLGQSLASGILPNVKNAFMDDYFSAAITNDNVLYTWGDSSLGHLGVKDPKSNTPGKVEFDNSDDVKTGVKTVSHNGLYTTAAVTDDGGLYVWGVDTVLGESLGSYTDTPEKVMDNVKDAICAGGSDTFVIALKNDGNVCSFGSNDNGQLGNNAFYSVLPENAVSILGNVKEISVHNRTCAAITNDNELYTWGRNYGGQVGNGKDDDCNKPVKILENVKSISLGDGFSAAITYDNELYMWGLNSHGQLGNGSKSSTNKPELIKDNISMVDLGYDYSAAIDTKGNLYTWGNNYYGQLGTKNNADSLTPVKILNNVNYVSLGSNHSGAITKDNELYTWGNNQFGELGDKTITARNEPVKVADNVKYISMGSHTSLAISLDDTLYTWGCNRYDFYLGDGTRTDRNAIPTIDKPKTGSTISTQNIETDSTGISLTVSDEMLIKEPVINDGTASFDELLPDEIYNIYAMRSAESEELLGSDNLLYIAQAVSDENGKLTVKYGFTDSSDDPQWVAVPIKQDDISNAEITMDDITYNDEIQYVSPIITFNGKTLTEDKDYYLDGDYAAMAVGEYTVTAHGKGLYKGTVSKTYKVTCPISECSIELSSETSYFRGIRIKPVVKIMNGETALKQGTDYTVSYFDNLSVGTARVVITGKGYYTGTTEKTFEIVQRSIANCQVELSAENYYFNGKRFKPTVKVFCNGTEMYSGNYTVTYSNNLSAGTATITLTGKKNLKGTVTKTFKINPRNIANCTVVLTKNSANKYQPTVVVKIGSNAVYSGNYTVKYTTSADKKTVKVTITGKGNLAGTTTKTYTVA